MKVEVKAGASDHFFGFFDHARRRPGDVFSIPDEPRRDPFPGEKMLMSRDPEAKAIYDEIKDKDGKIPQQFSFKWMQPVSESAKEKISTSQQAMDKRSEQIKQERAGQRALDSAGKTDVI